MVTITTNEELRWAKASAESQGSVGLYTIEVSPEQNPFFERLNGEVVQKHSIKCNNIATNGDVVKCKEIKVLSCIEE